MRDCFGGCDSGSSAASPKGCGLGHNLQIAPSALPSGSYRLDHSDSPRPSGYAAREGVIRELAILAVLAVLAEVAIIAEWAGNGKIAEKLVTLQSKLLELRFITH